MALCKARRSQKWLSHTHEPFLTLGLPLVFLWHVHTVSAIAHMRIHTLLNISSSLSLLFLFPNTLSSSPSTYLLWIQYMYYSFWSGSLGWYHTRGDRYLGCDLKLDREGEDWWACMLCSKALIHRTCISVLLSNVLYVTRTSWTWAIGRQIDRCLPALANVLEFRIWYLPLLIP